MIRKTYYLAPYISSAIPQAFLDFLTADFRIARNTGYSFAVRFAYSSTNNVDARIDTILLHISELAPVIRANEDVIATWQAGFIGKWGQWGSDTHGYDTNKTVWAQIVNAKLAVLTSRPISLPDNWQKRYLTGNVPLTSAEAFTGLQKARIGYIDDALMHSWDDAGGYDIDPANPQWSDTAVTKPFVAAETYYVPFGGEPNWDDDLNGPDCIREMQRMKMSYCGGWVTSWTSDTTWLSMTQHLGYRFWLNDVTLSQGLSNFRFQAHIYNGGYASPFNARGCELVFRRQSDNKETHVNLLSGGSNADPRRWLPMTNNAVDVTVPATLPSGTYSVFLNLPDTCASIKTNPMYSIRLANSGTWEPSTGYNDLGLIITVPGGTSGMDSLVDFKLEQNFPNPFNPSTTIRFGVPAKSHVMLTVFNVLGEQVAVLTNGNQDAGYHEVKFDGGNLASGVYFYRLQAASFMQTKRLLLVR